MGEGGRGAPVMSWGRMGPRPGCDAGPSCTLSVGVFWVHEGMPPLTVGVPEPLAGLRICIALSGAGTPGIGVEGVKAISGVAALLAR